MSLPQLHSHTCHALLELVNDMTEMLVASSSYCRKRRLEIDDSATRENAEFTHAVQVRIQEAVRRLILILIT
jgi:hypothetical protein